MSALARLALFLYGVGVIYGGYHGYEEAGSKASLIAGGVAGAVAILAFFISFKRRALGFGLGLLTSLAVGYMMVKRWLDKPVESRNYQDFQILVAAGSAVVILFLVVALAAGKKKAPPHA